MSEPAAAEREPGATLLETYDRSLPVVYGYLLSRCGQASLAEDLTADTFLAAVDAVRREQPPDVSTRWLIGVARHKLVDHWRRQGREDRRMRALEAQTVPPEDGWDIQLDSMRAGATLAQLGPHHRAALTFRYLDDLPVADVATLLGRTLHATEGLLVRARQAFRLAYHPEGPGDD